jgi:hypothetical protein
MRDIMDDLRRLWEQQNQKLKAADNARQFFERQHNNSLADVRRLQRDKENITNLIHSLEWAQQAALSDAPDEQGNS